MIGLPVAAVSYSSAIEWIFEKALEGDRVYAIEAANTHVAALARHESDFGEVMSRFDMICPDGTPLMWCVNRELGVEKKLADRVYGPTLMLKAIEASSGNSHLKHFLLGGSPGTLVKLEQKFKEDYPDAIIAGSYSPPFGEWGKDEFTKIRELIEKSTSNLIWVGLGCPKQERWIARYKDQLPVGCYFGIGAAFAFHAGEVRQAPEWIQKIGMEWFFRLSREPKRLFRRYFLYNSLFVRYLLTDMRKDDFPEPR